MVTTIKFNYFPWVTDRTALTHVDSVIFPRIPENWSEKDNNQCINFKKEVYKILLVYMVLQTSFTLLLDIIKFTSSYLGLLNWPKDPDRDISNTIRGPRSIPTPGLGNSLAHSLKQNTGTARNNKIFYESEYNYSI